ncbi:MAG: hypothetical protein U9N49_04305 [Campylobacterota bacterium]|nr:hypothetical protein [Campylobacterota bacterium]
MRKLRVVVWGLMVTTLALSAQNYNDQSVEALKYKLAQQKERIDGLTQIVEGMARTINELRENRSGGKGSRYSDEELIRQLGKMVDNINENYVSKAELKRAIDNLKDEYSESAETTRIENKPNKEAVSRVETVPNERIYTTKSDDVQKSDKERVVTPRVFDEDKKDQIVIHDEPKKEVVSSSGSNASKYAQAVKLYNKKQYSSAKKIFKVLEKEGFKEAPTKYYLGEIAYFTKRYEDAIYYFKHSAKLYTKASYMHTLLLHSAISLEKLGRKQEARKFYNKIVNEYSANSSVSIAKIRLEKLQ